jgi:hypothetical protein
MITRRSGVALPAAFLVGVSSALWLLPRAGAELDPSMPHTIVVGDPPGHAPSDRLGARRLGRARTALPRAPRELWRSEESGGLGVAPLVDARGGVVVALMSPDVVRLDAQGKHSWRTSLGDSPAAVAPVVTSDGSIAVVCGDGSMWWLAPSGAVRHRTALGMPTLRASATPVALEDGSVAVAGENAIVVVDSSGDVRARTALEDLADGGLVAWKGGVLVSERSGRVRFWRPPGRPRTLGELGGASDGGAVLVSERTLVAVVGKSELVALDLVAQSTTRLLSEADVMAEIEGPPVLDARNVVLVTTVAGELVGVDARGLPARRSGIESVPQLIPGDGGTAGAVLRRQDGPSSPPLVTDPQGRVAFFRSSGRVGVVEPNGAVAVASERLCARPLALVPAGPRRMVAACRSGTLVLYGEGDALPNPAPPPEAPPPGSDAGE